MMSQTWTYQQPSAMAMAMVRWPTSAIHVKEANSSINNRMPDSEGKKDSCLHKIKKLRGLKIASLNINSLLRHVDELRLMLSDSEIDVFAINESKIDNSVKDSEISIPGYNMIRKDRNRFGGGVVVYIRETYSFNERKI